MPTPFTKMHGIGNDFVVMRGQPDELPDGDAIRRIADRKHGIGCDQFLWLEDPRTAEGDVYYRIFNTDGSEAEQCGNGARAIARFVAGDAAETRELTLEFPGGSVAARVEPNGPVAVDMGPPVFEAADVPFDPSAPGVFAADDVPAGYRIAVSDETVLVHIASMGNPHGVLLVDDVDTAPVATLGPLLEHHAAFPNRANIGFMQRVGTGHVRLRVFERGVGETLACGTGACAAMVTGRNLGLLDESVTVELPGGSLQVAWQGPGHGVWLSGKADTAFTGVIDL